MTREPRLLAIYKILRVRVVFNSHWRIIGCKATMIKKIQKRSETETDIGRSCLKTFAVSSGAGQRQWQPLQPLHGRDSRR
jgi:hypothetical protein